MCLGARVKHCFATLPERMILGRSAQFDSDQLVAERRPPRWGMGGNSALVDGGRLNPGVA